MKKGFTIVELVLVIGILGIQAFMLGPPLITAVKEYDIVWSRRQALAESRSAMDRMVKEIQLIPSAAAVVSVASATQFQFQYPLGTNITYTLNGTSLQRNGVMLASNIGLLEFKYYDSAGVETATPASVRTIQIRLTRNAASNQGTIPLTTTVFLRNLGGSYASFTSP